MCREGEALVAKAVGDLKRVMMELEGVHAGIKSMVAETLVAGGEGADAEGGGRGDEGGMAQ